MPTVSEDQLAVWTRPASDSEDKKREDTERMIREAIRGHALLATLPIDVYAKGSYKNNTNVRRDSDVDVAVEYTGIHFVDYGDQTSQEEVRRVRGVGPYSGPFRDAQGHTDMDQFKTAVGDALTAAFGAHAVSRGNKVYTVREGSRSLAADVVPCASYRKYFSPHNFREGIQLLPDRWPGHAVHNYPQQHYDEGVAKNEQTAKRFKSVVRILKNLENKMVADGASEEVASFLIESLVYNAPSSCFLEGRTWGERVRKVLYHAWSDTENEDCEKRWMEVNNVKYLFHAWQKWDRSDARAFVYAAWQYVENS